VLYFLCGRNCVCKYYLDELRVFKGLNRVFVDRDKIEQKGDHPDLLLDDSIGRISRELWWSNQFYPVDIIPPCWARHVARVGGRKVYKVLVGKPEGKIPLGRPRRRWQDGITVDVREIG
jgi:hypothetical protein